MNFLAMNWLTTGTLPSAGTSSVGALGLTPCPAPCFLIGEGCRLSQPANDIFAYFIESRSIKVIGLFDFLDS
jgi:hypothetical protein